MVATPIVGRPEATYSNAFDAENRRVYKWLLICHLNARFPISSPESHQSASHPFSAIRPAPVMTAFDGRTPARGQNHRHPHRGRRFPLAFSMPCAISPLPCAPILSPSAKTRVRLSAVPPMGTPVATVIAWGGTGASERSLTWRPSPGGRPGYLGGHYDPSVPIGTKTARRP